MKICYITSYRTMIPSLKRIKFVIHINYFKEMQQFLNTSITNINTQKNLENGTQ